jgi:4-hydroxybenzoyl-CoA reductase subunit beta
MMPLPTFDAHAPESLDEAVALLERYGPNVAVLAGGTDLLVAMKLGLQTPRHVVSLRKVKSLQGISRDEHHLVIGAMTPLEEIANLRGEACALVEAAALVGGPHHRHAGTLGGNLCLDTRCRFFDQSEGWRAALGNCIKKDGVVCHVVPGGRSCVAAASNDTAAAAIALEGEISLIGPRGARKVAAVDFWRADGVRNTTLDAGEIVTALRVPRRLGRRSAYEKLRLRGSIDFPLLSVAVRVDLEGDVIADLSLVLSAVSPKPRVVARAKELAIGKRIADVIDAIATAAREACRPVANLDADVAWRREMAGVLAARALRRIAGS